MRGQTGEKIVAMNEIKIIDKAKLVGLLEVWNKDYEVVVPAIESGNLIFSNLEDVEIATTFEGRPIVNPKEYMFPQREKIFTFDTTDKANIGVEPHYNERKRIIWGIRPCDLKGIETLDTIFLSNYVDSYYEVRRKNTILIGLNCIKPCDTCFCNSCNAGPFAKSGFDILFTDLGNKYLVQIGSKAGEELVCKVSELFKPASTADTDKAAALEKASLKAFKRSVSPDAKKKLPDTWGSPLWQEESATCILCGGCNFVCPTCHCFNIEDIASGKQSSTRVRYWDSCQFGGFTQMAAENTRRTQSERLRQRIFHKYVYTPDKYNGAIGCTGCGRCIEVCPAEIDITHILGRVTAK
jgi:ferredoxin